MAASSTSTTRNKGYRGMGMEGPLARWYARLTSKDMGEFQRLAAELAGRVQEGGAILEVAPGPGYLAIELAKRGGYRVTGLDISQSFVQIATENAARAGVSVTFQQGNASAMPFDAHSFDFLVCRAAFKNFSDPVGAINEMHRVLKPGGMALIIDLRGDVKPAEVDSHVDQMRLSWFDSIFTKLTFRHVLIKRAYTSAQFRSMAAASRFGKCEVKESPIALDVTFVK
jgi:ubiquinone/menaquinone biosynthesis C-methylase UbiE